MEETLSGGDWKQLLPVTDVSADFSSDVCLMASPLWGIVKVINHMGTVLRILFADAQSFEEYASDRQ